MNAQIEVLYKAVMRRRKADGEKAISRIEKIHWEGIERIKGRGWCPPDKEEKLDAMLAMIDYVERIQRLEKELLRP